MLDPLMRVNQGAKAVSVSIPPPVGGWNTRDALDNMAPTDATVLENFYPLESEIELRRGYAEHSVLPGTAGTVKTLIPFQAGTLNKLVAAANGALYDVTTATAATIGTGFTEDAWQALVFGGRLLLFNGADAPQTWIGTAGSIASTAWTGSIGSVNSLVTGIVFKERVFLVEKNSQSMWYGGVKAVQGPLTEFDLSFVGQFGGNLAALGSLTVDGGDGIDDILCCFFESGDVVLYRGTDPSQASTWALVGRFHIGEPLGRRSVLTVGSDLMVLTQGAYVPLQTILPIGGVNRKSAISDKILQAAREATERFGMNGGWQACLYPKRSMLLVNVPRSTTQFEQHVINTSTGAWCKFTGLNGYTWAEWDEALYFGGVDGKVYKADTGHTDNGVQITGVAQPAWNYFSMRGRMKRFTAARLVLDAPSAPSMQMAVRTDFAAITPKEIGFSGAQNTGGVWDEAIWDQAVWATLDTRVLGWTSLADAGYAAAMRVRVTYGSGDVRWRSTTWMFEPGGYF